MEILGIDIGGSGIKGAIVNTETGMLTVERHRIPTPDPSTPDAVAAVIKELVDHFNWKGPVGCTFPAIIQHGVMLSAANVDDSWIGTNGQALFEEVTGCSFTILNDGDAAGVAEMAFGAGVSEAGEQEQGVVIMLTFGTGIGSAIFIDGHLLPNTEFGHLPIRGKDAEHRAASRIRDEENLSWKKWGGRVNEYLERMEFFFSPDLFIIGGGVSKKHEKFFPYLETRARIVPAALRNEAGIVGAAMYAEQKLQ